MSEVGPSGKWTQELLTVKRKKLAGLVFESHQNGLPLILVLVCVSHHLPYKICRFS